MSPRAPEPDVAVCAAALEPLPETPELGAGCTLVPENAVQPQVLITPARPPRSDAYGVAVDAPTTATCQGFIDVSCDGLRVAACPSSDDYAYHDLPATRLDLVVTTKLAATVTIGDVTAELAPGEAQTLEIDLVPYVRSALPTAFSIPLAVPVTITTKSGSASGYVDVDDVGFLRVLLADVVRGPVKLPGERVRPAVGGPAVVIDPQGNGVGLYPATFAGPLSKARYFVVLEPRDAGCTDEVTHGAPQLTLYDRWTGDRMDGVTLGAEPVKCRGAFGPDWITEAWRADIDTWLARVLPPAECGPR